jgi:hypothetical protein
MTIKICSIPSLGREVNPEAPCRVRFYGMLKNLA